MLSTVDCPIETNRMWDTAKEIVNKENNAALSNNEIEQLGLRKEVQHTWRRQR